MASSLRLALQCVTPAPGRGHLQVFANLRFKCADRIERLQALRLRDLIYQEETGHAPTDEFDDRGIHLVAVSEGDTVVAAARVLGPECRPFEFERDLRLSSVIGPNARIGLVGRFCVTRQFRQMPESLRLHLGMLKLLYLTAKKQELEHLVLYTFDHLITFYRGAHFRPIDGMVFLHRGYGKYMQIMQLDIAEFESRHLGKGGRLAAAFQSIKASA